MVSDIRVESAKRMETSGDIPLENKIVLESKTFGVLVCLLSLNLVCYTRNR